MDGRGWLRWVFWGVALVLHGLLLIVPPEVREASPGVATVANVEVEVLVRRQAPAPPRANRKDEAREPHGGPARPKPARRSRRPRGPAQVEREPEPREPPGEVPVIAAEPPAFEATTLPAPPVVGISPRDAARTLMELGPTECDAGVASAVGAGRDDRDPAAPDSSARLAAAFQRDASDDMGFALEPTPDGGFSYRSDVFVATIRPDGTVRFRDTLQEKIPLGLSTPIVLDGQTTRAQGAMFGLRVDRLVRDHVLGRQRHQAHKRTFMEHTEKLRAELAESFRQRMLGGDADSLRGRLAAIWGAPGASENKRRAIFELWDGCGDDAPGLLGKRIVEEFVREVVPRGSALSYSDAELKRLNAARRSREPFAPYDSNVPS